MRFLAAASASAPHPANSRRPAECRQNLLEIDCPRGQKPMLVCLPTSRYPPPSGRKARSTTESAVAPPVRRDGRLAIVLPPRKNPPAADPPRWPLRATDYSARPCPVERSGSPARPPPGRTRLYTGQT